MARRHRQLCHTRYATSSMQQGHVTCVIETCLATAKLLRSSSQATYAHLQWHWQPSYGKGAMYYSSQMYLAVPSPWLPSYALPSDVPRCFKPVPRSCPYISTKPVLSGWPASCALHDVYLKTQRFCETSARYPPKTKVWDFLQE